MIPAGLFVLDGGLIHPLTKTDIEGKMEVTDKNERNSRSKGATHEKRAGRTTEPPREPRTPPPPQSKQNIQRVLWQSGAQKKQKNTPFCHKTVILFKLFLGFWTKRKIEAKQKPKKSGFAARGGKGRQGAASRYNKL